MKTAKLLLTMWCMCILCACEQSYNPENEEGVNNVTLHVYTYEQMDFTVPSRAETSVKDVCTRLSIAVFSGDEKIKSISQKEDEDGFGTVGIQLEEGTYDLVVIAHSGTGTATISSPSKITFANNIVSDTFYYYGSITVAKGGNEFNIQAKRAVAMFRMTINDAMPANVKTMKFYYTGGSSTFDAVKGFGCVNSKQTVKFDVTEEMVGQPSQFEVYTLPHEQNGSLNVTVTALDDNDQTLFERTFNDVPMEVNKITRYSGEFFKEEQSANTFSLTVDNAWGGESTYNY